MTKITGTIVFNNDSEALEMYNKLDNIGYNVSLSSGLNGHSEINYVGFTEIIPTEKIEK